MVLDESKYIPTMSPWRFTATEMSVSWFKGSNCGGDRFVTSNVRSCSSGNLNNVWYKWGGANPADLDLNLALGIFLRWYTVSPRFKTTGFRARSERHQDGEYNPVKIKKIN